MLVTFLGYPIFDGNFWCSSDNFEFPASAIPIPEPEVVDATGERRESGELNAPLDD